MQSPNHTLELCLIGHFQIRKAGQAVMISHGAARLIAYLGLIGPARRGRIVSDLWPATDRARGAACLRSALSRVNTIGKEVITSSGDSLNLGDGVSVDIEEVETWINRAIYPSDDPTLAPPPRIAKELLPGWDEPWLVEPRERLILLQSQALESSAQRFLTKGAPSAAIPYALMAVQLQTMSESANRILIEAHLKQGDRVSALARFHKFRKLLKSELGIEPGPEIIALIRGLYTVGLDPLMDPADFSSRKSAIRH